MDKSFIPYEEALSILAEHRSEFSIVPIPLESCVGAYLAEDLVADRDFPPFNRVTMDGIAIAHDAFAKGRRTFEIEATAPAGSVQKTLINNQNCIEVMTGAILPKQTDTVVRYEDLKIDGKGATITLDELKLAQNVHFKGIDIVEGQCIVRKGTQLSSAEINIAAALGKADLKVRKMPKTVVISTGDELVPISETPKLHQIRRSNVYGIKNTLAEWHIPADLSHLPDDRAVMLETIAQLLLNYELLIFTGGVSKGKFDFLPEVLEELQIKKHFHKIQQRPGKPFWFGTDARHNKVFALPGNPVSSFVCVYVYLQYWLKISLGLPITPLYVKLGADVQFKPDLIYFLEATLQSGSTGTLTATPVSGNGSGDFANLVNTDGFLVLPQDKSLFVKGEVYPFVSYRSKF